MEKYIQCKLKRNSELQTAFITESKAIKGKVVDIGKKDNLSKGWTILEAYENITLNHDQMLLQRNAHMTQREASDI